MKSERGQVRDFRGSGVIQHLPGTDGEGKAKRVKEACKFKLI